MKKSDLKKLPVGSIFHIDYDGLIYKYIKIGENDNVRRIKDSKRYGVVLIYRITSDFEISKNSILVDNCFFKKGCVKVVKIEKPTQYDQIVME